MIRTTKKGLLVFNANDDDDSESLLLVDKDGKIEYYYTIIDLQEPRYYEVLI